MLGSVEMGMLILFPGKICARVPYTSTACWSVYRNARWHPINSQNVFLSFVSFCLEFSMCLQPYHAKGRLQNPTPGWPAVPFGSRRLSLFRTTETGLNRTEPLVNRWLGFEAAPKHLWCEAAKTIPFHLLYIPFTNTVQLPIAVCGCCWFYTRQAPLVT